MKKSKFNKKSICAFLLSALMMISMFSLATFCYAWEHPTTEAFNVTLYPDQYKTYSGATVSKNVHFEGRNCSTSQKCWFIPQYATNDDQSNYKSDSVQVLVSAEAYCNHTTSSTRSDYPWWRLCLDDYGSVNGVYAYGWMWRV